MLPNEVFTMVKGIEELFAPFILQGTLNLSLTGSIAWSVLAQDQVYSDRVRWLSKLPSKFKATGKSDLDFQLNAHTIAWQGLEQWIKSTPCGAHALLSSSFSEKIPSKLIEFYDVLPGQAPSISVKVEEGSLNVRPPVELLTHRLLFRLVYPNHSDDEWLRSTTELCDLFVAHEGLDGLQQTIADVAIWYDARFGCLGEYENEKKYWLRAWEVWWKLSEIYGTKYFKQFIV